MLISTILLTDVKIFLQWSHRKTQRITTRNCNNQEEKRHDKTSLHAYTINVQNQTVTDGISRRVTSGRDSSKHRFDTCRSRNQGHWGCYRNTMAFSRSAMRQISSEFFIFQQDSARRTRRLRQSTFLPITSTDFKNSFKADSIVTLQQSVSKRSHHS